MVIPTKIQFKLMQIKKDKERREKKYTEEVEYWENGLCPHCGSRKVKTIIGSFWLDLLFIPKKDCDYYYKCKNCGRRSVKYESSILY